MIKKGHKTKQEKTLLSPRDFGHNTFRVLREWTDEHGQQFGFHASNNFSDDDLSTPIYRYIDFYHLIQLIERKELYIPNRQQFTDKREYSDNIFKTLEEINKIVNIIPNYGSKQYLKDINERHNQIWYQAVSCWTYDSAKSTKRQTPENYLMWKCHSEKHYVCRIESSIQLFADSIKDLTHDILVSDVSYLSAIRFRIANTPSEIFIKPDFYDGEQELRFVVLQNDIFDCIYKRPIKLPINPQILIKGITLSPFIDSVEEDILRERLHNVIGDETIPINSSMVLEYYK